MSKVGIIDYGGGNLRSLSRAVESLGYAVSLVSKPANIDGLTHFYQKIRISTLCTHTTLWRWMLACKRGAVIMARILRPV